MIGNFANCWAFTATQEGGYSDIPDDPGNWTSGVVGVGTLKGTKFGISAASYPQLDIANLTLATAGVIFQRDYWDKIAGDSLPPGIDLVMFDAAVNLGVSDAARMMQNIVGVTKDGIIGPASLAAIAAQAPVYLIASFSHARLAFYQSLPEWPEFGVGWSNRNDACEKAAIGMTASGTIVGVS